MKHFSFNRLSVYEQCPRRFYFHYVLGYEEQESKALALGKAVHKAIELIKNGTDFEEAIRKGYIECDFHEEVSPDEIRQLVENAPKNLEGEAEVYFCLPLFDDQEFPKLQGYIDLVNGESIYDFKTNWKAYHPTDTYQLGLYAWAIKKLRGFNQIQGHLVFLRHKKIISCVYDENLTEQAISWARRLAREILLKLEVLEFRPDKTDELFPYKPSKACENCPFAINCYLKDRKNE